jgi:hypothetical protein
LEVRPDVTTENDKYSKVDSSVEKTDGCVFFVSMFGCILVIIWIFARWIQASKMEYGNDRLSAYFFIFVYGLGLLFSLYMWRRFADLMVRTLEMTKVTAENTAKLVELMSPDDQRGLKRGKTEPPAPS